MLASLGRPSYVLFVVSGGGFLLAVGATMFIGLLEPGPVVWALPALGLAVGVIAGAAAFSGLPVRAPLTVCQTAAPSQ